MSGADEVLGDAAPSPDEEAAIAAASGVPLLDAAALPSAGAPAESDDDDGFQIVMDEPLSAGEQDELDGEDDFRIVLDGHTASGNPYLPPPGSYPGPSAAPPGAPQGPRGLQYVREGAPPLAPRTSLPKPTEWSSDAAAMSALLASQPLPLAPASKEQGGPGPGIHMGVGNVGPNALALIPPPRPPPGAPPTQRPSGMHLMTAAPAAHPAGIPRAESARDAGQSGMLPGRSTPPPSCGPGEDGQWNTYDGKPPMARWNEQGQRILPGGGGGARFIPPEEYKEFLTLGHGGIFDLDLDAVDSTPWRGPGVDASDFFNYGLNERGWRAYAQRVRQVRMEAAHRSRIATLEVAPPLPPGQPPGHFSAAQAQGGFRGGPPAPYGRGGYAPPPQQQQQPYSAHASAPHPATYYADDAAPEEPPLQLTSGREEDDRPRGRDSREWERPRGGGAWEQGPPQGMRSSGGGGGGGGPSFFPGMPPPWAGRGGGGGGGGAPPWAAAGGGPSRPPWARDGPPPASVAPPHQRVVWGPPPGGEAPRRARSRSRDRDPRPEKRERDKRKRSPEREPVRWEPPPVERGGRRERSRSRERSRHKR